MIYVIYKSSVLLVGVYPKISSLFNFVSYMLYDITYISGPKYLITRIKVRTIIIIDGENGIPAEQYFKILKSPLMSFFTEIPKSPQKLNCFKLG